MTTDVYVSISTAASELGLTALAVRELMKCGRLNIGDAWKGGERWNFRVVRKLLDEEKARRGINDVCDKD